jgi:hypothetical protein
MVASMEDIINVYRSLFGKYERIRSRSSSVSIATGNGLNDRMIGVRFPAGAGNLSLRNHVQTGSGAHPTSYPMGTGGFFLGNQVAGL